jgi:SAM-dependent methyltransferase
MSIEARVPRAVRHADMTWTSFDRFGRYALLAELLADRIGAEPGVVLDVGDASGYLRRFLPDRSSVAVDLHPPVDPFPDLCFLQADGASLPFADRSMIAVVSCDVLEHVPQDDRDRFIGELTRVCRRTVAVAAPFDTAGVEFTEELVMRFAKVMSGQDQPQLTEHAQRGLPDLSATAGSLAERGWDVDIVGEGNLYDWLGMMLLRFANDADETTMPLSDGLDILYNGVLSARSGTGPFYRHVLVASPSDRAVGRIRGLDEALAPADLTVDALSSSFVGQVGVLGTSVATRRMEHALGQIERGMGQIEQGIGQIAAAVDPSVGQATARLEEALIGLAGRVDALHEQHAAIMRRLDRHDERTFVGLLARARRRLRR